MVFPPKKIHPKGELSTTTKPIESQSIEIETFEGKIHVEWEPGASVTPMGQLPFFIQFLKVGNRFEPWVNDSPLHYTSNNAPKKVDVLGSFLLSILSGHKRYAHIAALKGDGVNPKLLGMSKVVGDDSAREALLRMDEAEGIQWLQKHLHECYDPLLVHPWIMDIDVTVKPLYGHQEGAVKGYNPHKRGRPSHTYHTYMMANLKLILDVEVKPGNQSDSSYSLPGLVDLLNKLSRECWPEFVRGDSDWGNGSIMNELESIGCHYLFKMKKTDKVKHEINEAHCTGGWTVYDEEWEGKESEIKLSSWPKLRRIVIVRRRLKKTKQKLLEGGIKKLRRGQQEIAFINNPENIKAFEYSILVTDLDCDIISLISHYRNRADCENNFDEIKNQWGWGGYTTKDLKRCRFISRMVALIYNWWSLFVRLSHPNSHKESITSRPLLISSIGKLTESGRQKKITITSQHNLMEKIQKMQTELSCFFELIKSYTPELRVIYGWRLILNKAVSGILREMPVSIPILQSNTS